MEILIGLLCAITVYVFIYRQSIQKEKTIIELKKILRDMNPDLKDIIVDSIKDFEKRITSLEIEVAKIKFQAGMYAGVFSTIILFLFRVGEYLIFKK